MDVMIVLRSYLTKQESEEKKLNGEDLEKRFRTDSNGAVFARIIDTIRESFKVDQM